MELPSLPPARSANWKPGSGLSRPHDGTTSSISNLGLPRARDEAKLKPVAVHVHVPVSVPSASSDSESDSDRHVSKCIKYKDGCVVFAVMVIVIVVLSVALDMAVHDRAPSPAVVSSCSRNMPFGPINGSICHDSFAVGYSLEHKIPVWTSYVITKDNIIGCITRDSSTFRPDPQLPAAVQANSLIYRGSGFDRGHMVPAASRAHDERAYQQTFYWTNVIPQNPQLNRGQWKFLEETATGWAYHLTRQGHHVQILTGSSGINSTLSGGVAVPKNVWKVIIGNAKAIAFLTLNTASQDFRSWQTTITTIEQLSGIFIPTPPAVSKTTLDPIESWIGTYDDYVTARNNYCDF